MNRWRMVQDLRRDWQQFHARVLVMMATALSDSGGPALAVSFQAPSARAPRRPELMI